MEKLLTVCYFGLYNPDYIRNKVLITGLEKNNVKIIECQERSSGLKKYFRLFKKHWLVRKQYDIMIVGFPAQLMAVFARFLTKKKIVVDALVPLYDAMVFNHKSCKEGSLKAGYYWLLDWLSLHLANLIITDTNQHLDYYQQKFGIKKDKLMRIFVGANNEIFRPLENKIEGSNFIIEFHGFVYGEHGIEYIIQAAKILQARNPNIVFNIIGASKMYDQAKELAQNLGLKNINFLGRKSVEEIPSFMAKADVCLGLFGSTDKTKRVIPGKVFEIIACKKPCINADTPAMRELFEDKINCLLCQAANGESLAQAILTLKNDNTLKEKIANGGFELFNHRLKPEILGQEFKNALINLLK